MTALRLAEQWLENWLAQAFFSLNSLSWPIPLGDVVEAVCSQVPLATYFQALPWKSRVDVPAQVVPAPAAQFWTDEMMEQSYHTAREQVIASFERRYLTWLVNRAEGNMSKAARLAGVDRTTLYRLMERHGLQRETISVVPK